MAKTAVHEVGWTCLASCCIVTCVVSPHHRAAQGGLNLRTDQLAWPLSVSGLTLVVFALVIYPRLQARLGPLAAAKLGLLAAIPIVMLVPATSLVHGCARLPLSSSAQLVISAPWQCNL